MRRHFFVWLAGLGVAFTALASAADGTWSAVTTPNRGTLPNALNGVAVVSDTTAFAVGHYYDRALAGFRTLTLNYDGSAWRMVASPSLGSGYNDLYAVSATSAVDAWAVGYWRPDTTSYVYNPLILHWDGTAWRSISVSVPGFYNLTGVTAIAPDDVWVVGAFSASGVIRPLALHWDGARWSRVDAPIVTQKYNFFYAVHGTATNDVWAVGNAYVNGRYVTLTEHWDGVRWSVVPSPTLGAKGNTLRSVVVLPTGEAWALGVSQDAGIVSLRWDGAAWSVMPSAISGTSRPTLWALTALGPSVSAVGYDFDSMGYHPLVCHWDGTRWVRESTPNPGINPSLFAAGAADETMVAVGIMSNGTSDRTLSLVSSGR